MFLKDLIERLENNTKLYVGYPPNTVFDYSEIYPILKYSINNLGDPFGLKNAFSTHEFEKEVIDWFLSLYSKNKQGWGYVTSGGTEGNLFGLWNAREKLKNPILYFSTSAHFSIQKIARMLNLEYKIVQSTPQGEMDYDDLNKSIIEKRDAIIVATLGTTMTSSIDNVIFISNILKAKNITSYIHADAAIDGMILPFIQSNIAHQFEDGIESIAISGHKVIGSPMPCGVVLCKKNYISDHTEIDYVRNTDPTITTSRNGVTPVILWYALYKYGKKGFTELISNCIKNAELFCSLLNQNNIKAWRFDHSITIVLDKLPSAITTKWHAPSNDKYTALFALPKLTSEMVSELIKDIQHFRSYESLNDNSTTTMYPKLTELIKLND